MRRFLFVTALALFAVPCAAQTAQDPVSAVFPTEEETCFGQVIDPSVLTRETGRTIEALYVARLHTPDEDLEMPPIGRDTSIEQAREAEATGSPAALVIYARLRNAPARWVSGDLSCRRDDDGVSLRCGADCDGGGLALREADGGVAITFGENGVRTHAGCGEGRGPSIQLGAIPADREVRLTRQPVSACLAARRASLPQEIVRHGPPLRRLLAARGGSACFARRYDAAHLARNPRQQVAALTIGARWRAEGDRGGAGIDLAVVTTRRDGRRTSARATCFANGHGFECRRERTGETANTTVSLARGPNGSILLQTTDYAETPAEALAALGAFLGAPVRAGDETFRIDAAPDAACAGAMP